MGKSLKLPEEVLERLQKSNVEGTHSEVLRAILPEEGGELDYGDRKQITVDDDVAERLAELSGRRVPRWLVVDTYLEDD